eukprot:2625205-Rhodomonas_salina.2
MSDQKDEKEEEHEKEAGLVVALPDKIATEHESAPHIRWQNVCELRTLQRRVPWSLSQPVPQGSRYAGGHERAGRCPGMDEGVRAYVHDTHRSVVRRSTVGSTVGVGS